MFRVNEKYLKWTSVIFWNLKGLSVEIPRCGCQRDFQMGDRARLPITVVCLVNSYSSMKPWQESCHKFWLQTQSVASRKKRIWTSNRNVCCACGGFSHGSTLMAETGRQSRGWLFWGISIQSLQVYRQQHRHLEQCLVISYFKHASCTNFVSILVMCPRLSCKHRPLKSNKSWQSRHLPKSGTCSPIRKENLLDMCVWWNRSMVSRQHFARGGWISHRNSLSLVGNPCRLIMCVVSLLWWRWVKRGHWNTCWRFLDWSGRWDFGWEMDVWDSLCIAGDLGRFRNLNLLESGFDNIVTFPSQLTLKTTPTNSSLKLPSHVNDQDSDKNPRWQEAEVTRKDFNIVLIRQDKKFFFSELFKVIQDAISLILHYRTMNWIRTTSSSTFVTSDVQSIYTHSIMNSGLIPGGQILSKRRRYSSRLWIQWTKNIKIQM